MTSNPENSFSPIALKLFLLGISLIIIGALLITIASILSNGFASSGGIILIGPIPIILATGENLLSIIIIAAFVTILWLLFFFLTQRPKKTKT